MKIIDLSRSELLEVFRGVIKATKKEKERGTKWTWELQEGIDRKEAIISWSYLTEHLGGKPWVVKRIDWTDDEFEGISKILGSTYQIRGEHGTVCVGDTIEELMNNLIYSAHNCY